MELWALLITSVPGPLLKKIDCLRVNCKLDNHIFRARFSYWDTENFNRFSEMWAKTSVLVPRAFVDRHAPFFKPTTWKRSFSIYTCKILQVLDVFLFLWLGISKYLRKLWSLFNRRSFRRLQSHTFLNRYFLRSIITMGTQVSFIVRGFRPIVLGHLNTCLFFLVLGSKGRKLMSRPNITPW